MSTYPLKLGLKNTGYWDTLDENKLSKDFNMDTLYAGCFDKWDFLWTQQILFNKHTI